MKLLQYLYDFQVRSSYFSTLQKSIKLAYQFFVQFYAENLPLKTPQGSYKRQNSM